MGRIGSTMLHDAGRSNYPVELFSQRARNAGPEDGFAVKHLDRFLQRWRIRKVRPFIKQGAEVLDIGSADGVLARYVPGLGHYAGMDPDLRRDEALERGELIKGRFPTDLPEPRRFDCSTMLAVLKHIPAADQVTLAGECAKHLRPGGLLLITTPSPAVDIILDILKLFHVVDGMSLDQHYGFKPSETPDIFAAAGLELVKAARFQLGLNNLFVFKQPGKSVRQNNLE